MLPPSRNHKVVLIIEDNPDLADLIRTAIATEVGCYALVAQDATHALRYLHSVKPSLIVLDVYLPGVNGMDLYDILQRNEDSSNIPVLFLTAASDSPEFRERHFPNVLAKPFHLNSLLERVAEFCAAPATAREVGR